MKVIASVIAIFLCSLASSQKVEMWLDSNFRHVSSNPYYYAVNEQRGDSGWFLQAWYVKTKGLAIEGWFEDKKALQPNGKMQTFHENKMLKTEGDFLYGKKEGPWVEYSPEGVLLDSANFSDGQRVGVHLTWHSNGVMSDSIHYDANSYAVHISWNSDGYVTSAGRRDERGRKMDVWKYYNNDGVTVGYEEYVDGKRTLLRCFDDQGRPVPEGQCIDQPALFQGGMKKFLEYIAKSYPEELPLFRKLEPKMHLVEVEFSVDENGKVVNVRQRSQVGYGIEGDLMNILKASPMWDPAIHFGKRKITRYIFSMYITISFRYELTPLFDTAQLIEQL